MCNTCDDCVSPNPIGIGTWTWASQAVRLAQPPKGGPACSEFGLVPSKVGPTGSYAGQAGSELFWLALGLSGLAEKTLSLFFL